ncbi:protein rapunzel-like [Protopterus annectens]|uniref:protein rapunzel-like n=1 Tax=Protopterus annectens TaxID=7888 RepID=UPI001CF94A85|nr:protein rapunzel-like [Protopterus annectens]
MAAANEDMDKIKKVVKAALQTVAAISSAASVINPLFGLAGSLIKVVLVNMDDEDVKILKQQFKTVGDDLDRISEQNRNTLLEIRKGTVDSQYFKLEENIKNQYRMYMEVVEASPAAKECKKKEFLKSYSNDNGDQNLHTLYDGVMGKSKLFSRPILEVYMQYSQKDKKVMEKLCERLNHLFYIGLIALMGFSALIQDDEEQIDEDWHERMNNVQKKMAEVLSSCN